MGKINYLVGDATAPDTKERNGGIITHVCNDVNGWGHGFVMALSKKWKQPEDEFHRIPKKNRKVGFVQFIPVDNNLIVANMIGQNGLRYNEMNVPAVNYAAIEVALNKVCSMADSMNVDVHMPRIGCGLAGGVWEIMELIILRVLRNHKCDVYVYDFDGNDNVVAKLK